jgi:integral membrane protein (TIGR01906 family)
MSKKTARFAEIIGWAITIITPFMVLMLSIRMLITPLFAMIEYRMPGFPEDPYGFTTQDRLRWSEPSIKYLINNRDISFLEDLKFDSGEPIYNSRELSHMVDVKNLVTAMRFVLAGGMVLLLILSFGLVRIKDRNAVRRAYYRGGWAVLILMGTILLFVMLSFTHLFTWFHQLFFQSGTWMFYTSDTLIRLFPMRFWRDAFIFVGILSLIIASLIIILNRRKDT